MLANNFHSKCQCEHGLSASVDSPRLNSVISCHLPILSTLAKVVYDSIILCPNIAHHQAKAGAKAASFGQRITQWYLKNYVDRLFAGSGPLIDLQYLL
jgi:hypothetical protein